MQIQSPTPQYPQMQMTVADILEDHDRLQGENKTLHDENEKLKSQVSSLTTINEFATKICGLASGASITTQKALHEHVLSFVHAARHLILQTGVSILSIPKKLAECIIKICNFLWDHMGEIIAGAACTAIIVMIGAAATLSGVIALEWIPVDKSAEALAAGQLISTSLIDCATL